jgi:RHO1 GDP-GTP exchange protein 1/2
MIPATRSSLNGASQVVQWVCSDLVRTSSYFAMMVRASRLHLLSLSECSSEFGLYVNRHGDPSRSKGTIEWEGTAEHVAWHPPYILIFDSRFIEVRHVETGRLCQIISGHDLRCIWDGRGASISPPAPGPNGNWEEAPSQEARVHGVMRAEDAPQGRPGSTGAARGVVQHIFELIPTVPLFLPERLASPTQHSSFVHPTLNGSP